LFNWFGPGELTCKLSDGRDVELRLKTDYPRESRVLIEVQPLAAQQFALRLRIPYWSANTVVKLNGQSLGAVTPGAYLALDRRWEPEDQIEVDFDFTLHYWVGQRECADKCSIYRGPCC
jgi:DUF1680 family protein